MTNITPNTPIDLSQPQNFDIKVPKSWTRIIYNLINADKTEIWTCKVHTKSIEFMTADGILLGISSYSNWSSDVKIHMEQSNTDFTMSRNKGMFNERKSFTYEGQRFTWERMGNWKKSGLWKLMDDKEKVYAIVGHDDWKINSRFEICLPELDQGLLLAMLMTGISELESQRRLSTSAQASSINAGLASGAAAAASV